jgi:hypothetical protein
MNRGLPSECRCTSADSPGGGRLAGDWAPKYNDRIGLRAAAQSSERLEHRTVGFLASNPFDALTVRDVNRPLARRDLALEFLNQRGLSDAHLPVDKDDLSLATEGALPGLAQHLKRAPTPYEGLRRPAECNGALRGDRFNHRSDKPVSALRYGLDEKRLPRAISKSAPHGEDVSLDRLRVDHGVRPHGSEQLLVRDQPPGALDQVFKDREGLGRQQNALLSPPIAKPPETLVQRIQPECGKLLHRRFGGQSSSAGGVDPLVLLVAIPNDPSPRNLRFINLQSRQP